MTTRRAHGPTMVLPVSHPNQFDGPLITSVAEYNGSATVRIKPPFDDVGGYAPTRELPDARND